MMVLMSLSNDLEPAEKPDADIIPDETPPLPPDEPVKTDPIPEEAP